MNYRSLDPIVPVTAYAADGKTVVRRFTSINKTILYTALPSRQVHSMLDSPEPKPVYSTGLQKDIILRRTNK